MTDVTRIPSNPVSLGEMAVEIHKVIYQYSNKASVAEVIGVLEIVKIEVYQHNSDKDK
jgi:hypothetical protein